MTASAFEEIRRRALAAVESRGIDPAADEVGVSRVVTTTVDAYQAEAHGGEVRTALRDPSEMVERVVTSIVAYGPLTELLSRRDVEEVFIEGDRVTYLSDGGRLRRLAAPVSDTETAHLVARMLAPTDRRLDVASPIVQARVLDDSARLTAVIPPVADRLSATIRRYALRSETLEHLTELGSLTPPAAAFLAAVVGAGASFIVSGPPGAGKTSLLAAMLAATPAEHCVRCVEEVRELSVGLSPHSSFYEARPPGVDGRSAVTIRDLVKLVLAMRPDRIVVGEVRGAEAFELTRASNAGCGFSCTVHANSASDALDALVNAALMAGENVTEPVVRGVFGSTIDLVIHVDRAPLSTGRDGDRAAVRREVVEIVAVQPSIGGRLTIEPLFVRSRVGRPLTWTGSTPPEPLAGRLEDAAGRPLRDICAGVA